MYMHSNDKEFGKWIKKLRTDKGIGLRELARMSNISPSHLSIIESGIKSLSLKKLKSLCLCLGVEYREAFAFMNILNEIPTVMENLNAQ